MVCANAIWQTWVKPTEARTDVNSLFQHVSILRPNETGKFASKPGFRQMHDVIHHDIWASMLDCWRLEAISQNPEWTSLCTFADSKLSWDLIVEMSEAIVSKYVANMQSTSKARKKTYNGERDK